LRPQSFALRQPRKLSSLEIPRAHPGETCSSTLHLRGNGSGAVFRKKARNARHYISSLSGIMACPLVTDMTKTRTSEVVAFQCRNYRCHQDNQLERNGHTGDVVRVLGGAGSGAHVGDNSRKGRMKPGGPRVGLLRPVAGVRLGKLYPFFRIFRLPNLGSHDSLSLWSCWGHVVAVGRRGAPMLKGKRKPSSGESSASAKMNNSGNEARTRNQRRGHASGTDVPTNHRSPLLNQGGD